MNDVASVLRRRSRGIDAVQRVLKIADQIL
jgi:hypothetical protein